ncbi:MAG: hypothetical protein KF814_09350 [Nitrospiraceae bacterium]|mgnify:CR=1 FL=1|nr:hypothetical protein [Nitrospiraceae bacterium]
MDTSIEGVVTYLEDNDTLIKQLMETAETATDDISQLANQVDLARDEATTLIDQLGTVQFSIAKQDETRVRQKALLEAVAALRKKFETYKNDPLRRGIYSAEISNLYVQISNTFNNDTVAQVVPFDPDELSGYKDLLKNAILDTASRKKRAAVIKAAAQLSRLAIGVAGKLALV